MSTWFGLSIAGWRTPAASDTFSRSRRKVMTASDRLTTPHQSPPDARGALRGRRVASGLRQGNVNMTKYAALQCIWARLLRVARLVGGVHDQDVDTGLARDVGGYRTQQPSSQ